MLFEISRKPFLGEAEWSDLEGEQNKLRFNDLFVPGAAFFLAAYFLLAGNLVLLLFLVLSAVLVYAFLVRGKSEKVKKAVVAV